MHEALEQTDRAARSRLWRERDAEFARRGLLAAAVYPVLAASLWILTAQARAVSPLFVAVIAATSAFGIWRIALGLRFERSYDRDPAAWRRRYAVASIGTALCWGGFTGLVLARLGGHWLSVLMVFSAGIMASVFAAAHAAALYLVYGYLLAILSPMLAATLVHGGEFSHALAACTVVFAIHELTQTHRANATYRRQASARLESATRAAELERAREQTQQAQRLKQAFLANMSHELRTPLNGVLGLLDSLHESVREPAQRELVTEIRACASQLCRMFDQLTAVSCLEAGMVELSETDFDPVEQIERIAMEYAPAADRRGIEIVLDLDPALPEATRADACRFAHVLDQLVANAVKFTERGRIEICARAERFTAEYIDLRVEVADTGPGIDAADRKRIFERFVQLDDSNTRRHGGLGLGLALARELAHMMGGDLHAERGLLRPDGGYGARFIFRLRMPWLRPRGQSGPTPAGDFIGMRIAILDDCAALRRVLAERLRSWGAHVDQFAHAQALLELGAHAARAGEPLDLLLIDLEPGGCGVTDGLAFAEQVRETRWGRQIELVLLAPAGAAAPECARLAALGFEATIRKPVRTSVLYETLAVYRGRRKGRASVVAAGADTNTATRPAALRPLRILLAEDNPVNQRVALRMLEKLGHHCEVVDNGRAAVQAVEKGRYDVILMDCQMPELDGFEATRRIRAFERRSGRRTPVIAMTAHVLASDRERCFAAGMYGFVGKPVDIDQLLCELERLLPRRA